MATPAPESPPTGRAVPDAPSGVVSGIASVPPCPHLGGAVFVGRSPAARRLVDQLVQAAGCAAPVLLTGETGTGKDLAAWILHCLGGAPERRFVPVNAASLSAESFTFELVGTTRRELGSGPLGGLLGSARGGSLYLDAVGELAPECQSLLLELLHARPKLVTGGSDVRLLSASSDDLRATRLFRHELFYRLKVLEIRIPSLAQRAEDLPLLVEHCLGRAARLLNRKVPGISREALEALRRHDWPGNVRELLHELERAVVRLGSADRMELGHLSARLTGRGSPPPAGPSLRDNARRHEAERLLAYLEDHDWNVAATARTLGMSRPGLAKKIRGLGLRRPY